MPQTLRPDDPSRSSDPRTLKSGRARDSAVAGMMIASVFAVAGTLVFAWALRAPQYPWLFAVGALPWLVGIALFSHALWRYTRN